MKNKIKIYKIMLLGLFALSISIGCSKDDYNIHQSQKDTNKVLRDRTVTGSEALSIKDKLNAQLGNTGLNKGESSYGTIDYTEIRNVLDMSGKDNYTFRVLNHPESSKTVFFNLVMVQRDGYTTVMLVKYEMDPVFADAYYNKTKDFVQFSGTVSFSLISSDDPCPPVPPKPVTPTTGGGGGNNGSSPDTFPDQGSSSDSSLWQMYMTVFYAEHAGDSANNGSGNSNDTDDDGQGNHAPWTIHNRIAINSKNPMKDPCDKGNTIGVLDPQDYLLFDTFITTLSTQQQNWINSVVNKTDRYDIFRFLENHSFSLESLVFANQLTQQYVVNPGFHFDAEASFKSPFNIYKLGITDTTPEGQKFNAIYDKLMESDLFKSFFVAVFGNSQNRFNVLFQIQEHIYDPNNSNIEINATTQPINADNNNLFIKINKQILTATDGNMMRTNLERAKTILHECIHAYLHVKGSYPNVSQSIPGIDTMDVQQIINASYPNNSDQHDYMYSHLIPTMQAILQPLLNDLTTQPNRNVVEALSMHPYHFTDNSISETWSWDNYFYYLSLQGLENCHSFQADFQLNQDKLYLYNEYKNSAHGILDK